MSQPIDAEARTAALDIHKSFAVSAPAGSGKTGLLTQRVLALLTQCEQPESVLAITFTKKAAAEMQNRILSALLAVQEQLENNQPPPKDEYELITWNLAKKVLERDRLKQWQLLDLPNRLRITTIDGFCRQLSQQNPLSNGMGNAPGMLETKEAEHAYLLAARETLALLEKKSEVKDDLVRITKHFNNQISTIENLFVKLLSRRDQWLQSLFSSQNQRQLMELSLSTVIADHLNSVHCLLLPYGGELLELADYAAKNLSEDDSQSIISLCLGIEALPQTQYQGLANWQAIAELVLTKDGKARKTINKNLGFPPADKKTSKEQQALAKSQKERMLNLIKDLAEDKNLVRLLNQTRQLPQHEYEDKQWHLLDSLTRVLSLLVANLSVIFQQLGKADFIHITQAALNTLGDEEEPSDIALLLDYQILHILVDEFQDTSSPQLQLLKRLTAGWQEGDGKTLFLVGDAMQSCYSFREANVGIFLDVRQNGIGQVRVKPLDLSVNFRSQANLVEWFNTIFKNLFPKENSVNEGAVKYLPADAFKQKLDNPVSSFLFNSTEMPKVRNHEATKIVEIIQDQQGKQPSNTIAILVRTRTQVGEITRALNHANIDYQATELDKLNQSMVVQDLLTLTRALLYPNDRIAWLALLRAPWCGMDMTDLYQIANQKINNSTIPILSLLFNHSDEIRLSLAGKNILTRFTKNLNSIFSQQGKLSLRNWIEGAWLQLGGDALLLDDEEKNETNTFFNCLEKYQTAGKITNWSTFTKIINELYNINHSRFKQDKTEEQNTNKPVEIMTIHKSKGLEFDTVILPGLDLGSKADSAELLAWIEWLDKNQQSKLLISPVHGTGNDKDPIYDYIRSLHKYKQQLEADRLFYVACTRAIKHLYLLGYVSSKNESLNKPSESSSLGRIWDNIINESIIIDIDNEKNSAPLALSNQHPNKIIRLTEDWQRPAANVNPILKKYRLDNSFLSKQNENIPSNTALLQREKRYFGQVLHAALQHITETGYTRWDENRIVLHKPFWANEFIRLGLSLSKSTEYADRISSIILSMKNSRTASWLLNHSHIDSECELSVYSMVNGIVKERIIDRTFVDRETNIRWIIDYKSSEPDADQDLDAFIMQEVDRYRDQLKAYESYFMEKSEPICSALYFPALDILKKIVLS